MRVGVAGGRELVPSPAPAPPPPPPALAPAGAIRGEPPLGALQTVRGSTCRVPSASREGPRPLIFSIYVFFYLIFKFSILYRIDSVKILK